MFKKILILISLISIFNVQNSFAFSYEELMLDGAAQEFDPNIKPLKVTGDAIKWELFATTKSKTTCSIDKDGFDDCYQKPTYSPKIKALNNKYVTLTGFMFPLGPSEKQTNFLLGPYPASCPFNYHVSNAQIVEVISRKPIKFSYDPITVKGILSVKHNKETGIFYYLNAI